MKLDINNYPGSKAASGLWQMIINHIPECTFFYEAFAGGAAITRKLLQSNHTVKYFYLLEKSINVFNQLYEEYLETSRVHVKRIDSLEVLSQKLLDGINYDETFFYFDPPYLKDSRRNTKDIYEHEFSIQDHEAFFDLIRSISREANCDFLISHYPCKEYDDLASELNLTYKDINVMTRGGVATERIYMNYDINERRLACTDYLGHGRQERQRISRKKKRWANAIAKMPPAEAQAILDEINRKLNIQ